MTNHQEAERRELDYLVAYAHDDWLGFSVISGAVGTLLGSGAPAAARVELLLRLVGALYDAGARPGNLTDSAEEPFRPWPLERTGALERIAAEVRALPGLPDSGDVCWFAVP
ncbi:hypothetical protein AB0A60_30770 [Streptomyces sp. NPDC046275]|uniref:hypothetical protein n=1 Tax=Streptomyces sp. NPDC046275 TaxID=3157201 RepID=UPI0033C32B02